MILPSVSAFPTASLPLNSIGYEKIRTARFVSDDYAWFSNGVSQYLTELRNSPPLFRVAGSQLVIYNRNQNTGNPNS